MSPRLAGIARSLIILILAGAGQLAAVTEPDRTATVGARQTRHPDLVIKNGFQRARDLPAQAAERAHQQLDALGIAPELARFDVRGGRWGTLMPARPLLPGRGNDLTWDDLGMAPPAGPRALEQAAWQALTAYLGSARTVLEIDPAELPGARVSVHGDGSLIQIHAPRVARGRPVRSSYLTAVVRHGNLVLFGVSHWGNIEVPAFPEMSEDDARDVMLAYLDPFTASAWGKSDLAVVPLVRGGQDITNVAVGQGYDYRLAWVMRPRFDGEDGTWEALVDAMSGELLAFEDTNHYQSTREVMGGVYPVSNDGINPDGIEQGGWPTPSADITVGGVSYVTDACGNLPLCVSGNATSTLCSDFVCIKDNCGAINLTGPGSLDFGLSFGTDCTTPGFGGAGNTHAARTAFYEVNRIKESARGQLPNNAWLSQPLTVNTNINNTCNAFWNGSTLNFYRSGGGCANTGELAGVIDHEWGHGLDDNDANGFISNPGEAIADIYMALRLNSSCIGRGFRNTVCTLPDGASCKTCTGVRDIDWLNITLPPLGTMQPHDLVWVQNSCPAGGSPCGGSTHCESAVYSEAVWDLYTRDLPGIYTMSSDTALEVTTRLTYLGAGLVGNAYQCNVPFGGCNADSAYLNPLVALKKPCLLRLAL